MLDCMENERGDLTVGEGDSLSTGRDDNSSGGGMEN